MANKQRDEEIRREQQRAADEAARQKRVREAQEALERQRREAERKNK